MDVEHRMEAMRKQMQEDMEKKLAEMRCSLEQESKQTSEQEEKLLENHYKLPSYHLPATSELQEYKKRSGTANMAGELFEVHVAMYLFIKGMFETDGFYLAANVDNAGAFDDIVFRFKDKDSGEEHTCFLQLKYKARRSITYNTLYAPSGDFSLLKYYSSFCDIRRTFSSCPNNVVFGNKFDSCEFIIYTNTNMESISSKTNCYDSKLNILNSNDLNEKIVVLCKHETKSKSYSQLEKYREALKEILTGNLAVDVTKDKLIPFKQLDHCKKLLEGLSECDNFKQLLNEQLREVEDSSIWDCFINKLKIFTNQATDKDLEALIQKHIEFYCGTTPSVSREITYQLKTFLLEWWRTETHVLSERSASFWDSIIRNRISHLVQSMSTKLSEVGELRYNTTHDMTAKINTLRVLHIFTGDSTVLSCLKVKQCLANIGHIMIDSKSLQINHKEVLAYWTHAQWCKVLVVEGTKLSSDLVTEIANVLRSYVWKKFIFVSDSKDDDTENLCEEFGGETCVDVFRLNQLNSESVKRIMKRQVNFQGVFLPLNFLIDQHEESLQDILTADVVVELLKNEKFDLGNQLQREDISHIPRLLLRNECVDENIMFIDGTERIAISGSTVQELQNLIPSGETIRNVDSRALHDGGQCRYFHIASENDFCCLSQVYKNIHWLHKEGDCFFWKRSKGDMKIVRNFLINSDRYTEYSIEEIIEHPDKIVLIVAEPGMGKSTELSHLAERLKAIDQTTWVIRVNLNDFSEYLNQNRPTAFELLCRASKFDTAFQKRMFGHALYKKGNVIILLDGFDEISPRYTDKCIAIIKGLKATRCHKIWLTSRHIMKSKLETELSVLAFELKPFSKKDQIRFLLSHWELEDIGNRELEGFVTPLLRLVAQSLSGRVTEFTGVPLIMKMISEIYQPIAMEYTLTGDYSLPKRLDLLKFYEDFIERKWEIYCERNGINVAKGGVFDDYEDLKNIFQENHVMLALLSVLSAREVQLYIGNDIEEKMKPFLAKIEKGQEKTGIIREVLNGKPIFTHKLFSEYFVAIWFSSNFVKVKEYLETKLFESEFQVVRIFLDRILCKNFDLHVAVINQDIGLVKDLCKKGVDINLRDGGGRTPLHLAVLSQMGLPRYFKEILEIIQFLLDHGASNDFAEKIFSSRPLQLAIKIEAWNIVDTFLNKDKQSEDLIVIKRNITNNKYIEDILLTATTEGLVNIVEFLLQCGIHVDHRISVGKSKLSRSVTILHEAARKKHLSLVKCLVNNGADFEASDSYFNRTALMWGAPDLEIVNFLKERGADPVKRDNYGNTALMRAVKYGRLDVVRTLSEVSDMTVRDKFGNGLLHLSVYGNNLNLVKYLVEMGLDTNCFNYKHETPLLRAAALKRWYIVEYLLSCSNLTADESGNNLLHICAHEGNSTVTKMILDKGCDVNLCNEKCETALFRASRSGQLKIVQMLLDHNADFNVSNNIGYTPLHIAAKWDKFQIAQCLVHHGASINMKSKYGYTPLDLAMKHKSSELLEFFQGIQ